MENVHYIPPTKNVNSTAYPDRCGVQEGIIAQWEKIFIIRNWMELLANPSFLLCLKVFSMTYLCSFDSSASLKFLICELVFVNLNKPEHQSDISEYGTNVQSLDIFEFYL